MGAVFGWSFRCCDRTQVEKSLLLADDPRSPRYTTDEVMRRMDKIIKAAEVKNAARHLAG